jgi:two-component system, cell cycle response regulator
VRRACIFPYGQLGRNVMRDDETTQTGPILDVGAVDTRQVSSEAIVVILHPAGANPGRRHALTRAEHYVGRRSDLDLHIDVDSVSRRHARLVRHGEDWWVEDLGSTNGTFVNHDPVERHKLEDGDIIRFGEAVVKFLAGGNIEHAYHEEVHRLSILDGLTSVHNKRFFEEVLEREVARSQRHGGSLALVLFDIDHFKQINDTYGHLAGDTILVLLCRRIRPRIRREDVLARVGGEEFACLLTETTRSGAVAFAEDVRLLVEREPFACDGALIPITISLGVAGFEPPAPSAVRTATDETNATAASLKEALDLVRRADERLYKAKRAGRNRVA